MFSKIMYYYTNTKRALSSEKLLLSFIKMDCNHEVAKMSHSKFADEFSFMKKENFKSWLVAKIDTWSNLSAQGSRHVLWNGRYVPHLPQ